VEYDLEIRYGAFTSEISIESIEVQLQELCQSIIDVMK